MTEGLKNSSKINWYEEGKEKEAVRSAKKDFKYPSLRDIMMSVLFRSYCFNHRNIRNTDRISIRCQNTIRISKPFIQIHQILLLSLY